MIPAVATEIPATGAISSPVECKYKTLYPKAFPPKNSFHHNIIVTKHLLSHRSPQYTHAELYLFLCRVFSRFLPKGAMVPQASKEQGSYLRVIWGWGVERAVFRVEGRRAGSFLVTSSEGPGFQLISSRLRELLVAVQLLPNFELLDCCGCCTFGDLPSFSLEEGVWKQEKKKKRERGRERKGGGLYCVL